MVVPLSDQKRTEILMMMGYGENRRSCRQVAALFNRVHPENKISQSTVSKIARKFERTGTVRDRPKSGRPKTATSEEKTEEIIRSVKENPRTSTTQLALDYNISQTSAERILRRAKLKPYKAKLIHELKEDDPEKRLRFCEMMMDRTNRDDQFLNNILFSDESTFCINGAINRQNNRYWASKNPNWTHVVHNQKSQKVNVWAGIIDGKIVGPFFIDGKLDAERYLLLLRHQVLPALAEIFPDENRRNKIHFQQDGAPHHSSAQVRSYLNRTFPNRWIGRRGPIEWPPRSPDLTPLDFFLWGYLKNKVYVKRPQTLEDLKCRIEQEAEAIPREYFENSIKGVIHRVAYCQENCGLQFEHLIH